MTLEEFNTNMTRLINKSDEPLHKKAQLRHALRDVVRTLSPMVAEETQYGIQTFESYQRV